MAATTPVGELQEHTQTSFMTLNLITQSCEGVRNTVFVPPPEKPSWFDELNAKLDKAKGNATTWINELAPSVTAGVPKITTLDPSPLTKTLDGNLVP